MAIVRDKSGNADHRHDYAQMTFAGRITPTGNSAIITPSNTEFIHDAAGNRAITKCIVVGTGGEIYYKNEAGMSSVVTVGDGAIAYVRATQVLETTTAQDLTGYF